MSTTQPQFHKPTPLDQADVLVVEGTLDACMRAHELARGGASVALATSGTSLPRDIVVCRRPWLTRSRIESLPEPFAQALAQTIEHELSDDEVLVNLAQFAVVVEDLLLDAGVKLLYSVTPCAAQTDAQGEVTSVQFGGKFGLMNIATSRVIDATDTHDIARFAGCRFEPNSEPTLAVKISAKVAINDRSPAQRIDAPQSPQICPTETLDQDVLHIPDNAYVPSGIVKLHGPYAAFDLCIPVEPGASLDSSRVSVATRRALIEVGIHLNEARTAAGLSPLYFHRFSGALITSPRGRLIERPGNVELGVEVPVRQGIATKDRGSATSERSFDIVVAGAGTSGVPAALAAAQAGANVCLIEQQADVGGTQTVGGVNNYWFGRETPFQIASDTAYAKWTQKSGMAREVAMMQCLTDAGVTVIAPATLTGAQRDGDRITGVVIANEDGLTTIRGAFVIDATGDADIAAWAGVPYEFGNGRDAWTIWASFANFNEIKRTASRHYESSVDVTDAGDFLRGVVMGRRRPGMWRRLKHEMPQHYFAPRETRRIQGRAQVTYSGILAGESFADLMIVCDSNFDIKGIATSDLLNCGIVWSWIVKYRYLAAIPFRAIRPEAVENLLVVGRGYSVSHDAQALARMQRDMVSLGAGAGVAAAHALAAGKALDEIATADLQQRWVAAGTLRKKDLKTFGDTSQSYTAEHAQRDVEALAAGEMDPPRLARLARSPHAVAPLREAFSTAMDIQAKTYVARLLCYHGDPLGVDFLIEQITEQTREGLPQSEAPTLAIPPEHGWAPQPVYSLYALGLCGAASRAGDVMLHIAKLIPDDADSFWSKTGSPFEYVHALCSVAERDPCPESAAAIEVLAEKACMRGLGVSANRDPREVMDPAFERRAYCELSIGRALARCGDTRGIEILNSYASDIRVPLARSARDELHALQAGTPPLPYTHRIH